MDRFEDKAREICERISRDQAAFISGTTEALIAAILRAAAEMGKPEPAGEPAPRSHGADLTARMAEHVRRIHASDDEPCTDGEDGEPCGSCSYCIEVALLAEYDAATKEPTP